MLHLGRGAEKRRRSLDAAHSGAFVDLSPKRALPVFAVVHAHEDLLRTGRTRHRVLIHDMGIDEITIRDGKVGPHVALARLGGRAQVAMEWVRPIRTAKNTRHQQIGRARTAGEIGIRLASPCPLGPLPAAGRKRRRRRRRSGGGAGRKQDRKPYEVSTDWVRHWISSTCRASSTPIGACCGENHPTYA